MKKVLVTGENGYIGTKFRQWIENHNNKDIILDYISVKNGDWEKKNFGEYDTILHLAGIAHVSRNPKLEDLYYKVNRDLSINLAEKSKNDGVKHFIFMSSIIVYGSDSKFCDNGGIDESTIPIPEDFYGRSKLEADLKIQSLSNNIFKTTVIRAPLVYGPGSKGNFTKLLSIAKITPIFLNIENKRSMIYIENLFIFIEEIIKKEITGLLFPQNKEYVSTKDIIKYSAMIKKHNIRFLNIDNFLTRTLIKKNKFLNKIFGNKFYKLKKEIEIDYQKVDFKESISKTMEVEKL